MEINRQNLTSWAIDYDTFIDIKNINPAGILEFGSGTGTVELCKLTNVYSIEHDNNWINKAASTYIHTPLENIKRVNSIFPKHTRYYSDSVLRDKLPKIINNYSLVLVDGPPGQIGRSGILNYLDILNMKAHFIFDDTDRPEEEKLVQEFVKISGKQIISEHKSTGGKKHTIIL
jgi:hypothetical protein